MGATQPLVRIEAATLAGGEVNQDRYAYGDGWAFVLDGASSINSPQSVNDGGWYAERLKDALTTRLRDKPSVPTVDLVADAIADAASAHDPRDGECPTSTIALARWNTDELELFVLGDSYAISVTDDGLTLTTDERLAGVAPDLRAQYRRRLAHGSGFDATHRALLSELQQREAPFRNRDGGYWIAGNDADAARHAVTQHLSIRRIHAVALATDGVLATNRGGWPKIMTISPGQIIRDALRREQEDAKAIRYPRSKVHDDKTIIIVRMR